MSMFKLFVVFKVIFNWKLFNRGECEGFIFWEVRYFMFLVSWQVYDIKFLKVICFSGTRLMLQEYFILGGFRVRRYLRRLFFEVYLIMTQSGFVDGEDKFIKVVNLGFVFSQFNKEVLVIIIQYFFLLFKYIENYI